jgi:hypothetical protein
MAETCAAGHAISPLVRTAIVTALADPSPESWDFACVKLAEACCEHDFLQRLKLVKSKLRGWPVEVARPAPDAAIYRKPSHAASVAQLAYAVRETNLYPVYVEQVCASPLLRRRDGGQAVHLARAFTGRLDGGAGQYRIGEAGQGDLTGGLVVDYCARAANRDRRIEVRLEVEVKTAKGRIREDQALRQAAFTERGGLYIITRSIADCIAQLVAARERIRVDLL